MVSEVKIYATVCWCYIAPWGYRTAPCTGLTPGSPKSFQVTLERMEREKKTPEAIWSGKQVAVLSQRDISMLEPKTYVGIESLHHQL